jgi:hypothetical protein
LQTRLISIFSFEILQDLSEKYDFDVIIPLGTMKLIHL